jgi:hypothetical protein
LQRPVRRQPQRSCVACRATADKRTLLRIVRSPDGRVEVDAAGKKPGRGAYLCRRLACWQDALKRGRLETALRTRIGAEDKLALVEFAASIEAVEV